MLNLVLLDEVVNKNQIIIDIECNKTIFVRQCTCKYEIKAVQNRMERSQKRSSRD
eukprot:UN27832